MKLLLSLFLAAAIALTVFATPKEYKLTASTLSTIDTPARKIPVYIIIIPQSEYFKMADTSNMIMYDYGIELTGSAIRSGQSAMARQWNRLIDTYSKTDSVKIQGGRK